MSQVKPPDDLRKRLDSLHHKRDAALKILNQIRDLLAKADARRASGQGDSDRWTGVVENLEKSLIEARIRLQRCDLVIFQVECQLGIRQAPAKLPSDSAGEFKFAESDFAGPLDPDKALEQVLAMSLNDLSKLTMEEVALLHARLPEREIPLELDELDQAESRLELANQTRTSTGEDSAPDSPSPRPAMSKFQERRNQLLLRATLEKVRANRFADITREEKSLLANCLEMLLRRIHTSEREERLKVVLREALEKLGWPAPAV